MSRDRPPSAYGTSAEKVSVPLAWRGGNLWPGRLRSASTPQAAAEAPLGAWRIIDSTGAPHHHQLTISEPPVSTMASSAPRQPPQVTGSGSALELRGPSRRAWKSWHSTPTKITDFVDRPTQNATFETIKIDRLLVMWWLIDNLLTIWWLIYNLLNNAIDNSTLFSNLLDGWFHF